MGPDRRHAGERSLTRIVRVVPSIPTFAVDGGFRYRVPDGLDGVTLGSMVRVPLGGRRTRGFVVEELGDGDGDALRPVLARVGDLPLFTRGLLETMRWASVHYVAPFPVLLAKSAPPNVPRRLAVASRPPAAVAPPVADWGTARRSLYLVGGGPWPAAVAGLVAPVLTGGRTAAVVCATVAEAHRLAAALEASLGVTAWLATSSEPAAAATRAWAAPWCAPGQLVVGTREIALWPLGPLGVAVVVEEGRAAMKSAQTPTVGVRDVVRRRSQAERFAVVLAGSVPTIEALASGVEVREPAGRVWPLVEVADRASEPPGSGVLLQGTVRAIAATAGAGGRVLVFVSRKGEAAAFRCVACGAVRTCAACLAAATGGDRCRRCGEPLGRCRDCGGARFQALGAAAGRVIGELRRRTPYPVRRLGETPDATDDAVVLVGTEADLPGVDPVELAVVVDADALVLAPHYRAEEDALRLLARVAATVGRGGGRRCLVQTAQPGHRVIQALRRGRPLALLGELLEERRAAGYPPAGELMAVETAGSDAEVDAELRAAAVAAEVLGPASVNAGRRWLVHGTDLLPTKRALRPVVQSWRDRGVRVRIDADPVRL